ncbi:MAG: LamG domain-containing protein [Myxococcota bacterium]
MTRRLLAHASLWACLVFLLLCGPALSQPEATPFTPLLLDGQTSLTVEASPGLELGDASTIEFLIATAWEAEDGVDGYPAVLGRREPYEGDEPEGFAAATQYSVHVTPDRQAIGLFDGERFASVPFDFSDSELHHVALVTKEGRTTIYVDREARGTIELGLGEPSELPLHLGSSDGGSELFMGALPSVRLWRRALTAEQVAAIADVLGAPDDGSVSLDDLAAYGDFTNEEPEIVVLEAVAAPETSALPTLPARTQEANVESRGLKEKVKQKQLTSKKKKLTKTIAETEAALGESQQQADRIRKRLAKFENAKTLDGERIDLGGNTFRVGKVRVGRREYDVGDAARRQQNLQKALVKVDRKVEDYTRKLDGAPAYGRGGARRGLRRKLADVPDQPLDRLAPVAPSSVSGRLTADTVRGTTGRGGRRLRAYGEAADEPSPESYDARVTQFRKMEALLNEAEQADGVPKTAVSNERKLLQDTLQDETIMRSPSVVSPTHAMELKRLGLQPSKATRVADYTDANLEGEATKPGSGAFNTVYLVKHKVGDGESIDGVFKPEVRRGTKMPVAATETGIDSDDPRSGYRTLATTRLDRLLNLGNLTTPADMAIHDQTLGTVSSVAKGVQPRGRKVATEKITSKEMVDLIEAQGVDDFNADANMTGGRTITRRQVDGGDEYWYETPEVPDVNYGDPRLRRDLVRLQLMDAIAGQVDRHSGNYFVQQDASGRCTGVQGIDNDVSWGKRLTQASGALPDAAHLPKHLPPYVDREAYDSIMRLKPSAVAQSMNGLLTQDEIAAASQRLSEVQTHLRGLQRQGRVLDSLDAWSSDDVTEGLTTPADRTRGGDAEYNSYVGRDLSYQNHVRQTGTVVPYPQDAVAAAQ